MKTMQWILVVCRVVAISCGLPLLSSGCGDQPAATSNALSEEEKKRNNETRKAMEEAAAKAATKKAGKSTH